MKPLMVVVLLVCSLLTGCDNPEETRQYLQRELFDSPPPPPWTDVLTRAKERLGAADTAARSRRVTQAHGFSEGLAAVRMKGGWGYIDTTGRLCIPARYDEAEDFVSGSAVVCRGRKWGLIDRQGDYILPPRFEELTAFQDSVGFVRFELRYNLVDLRLRQVVALAVVPREVQAFSEGLAAVQDRHGWGFVDREGRVVIACRYEEASSFSEGLCAVAQSGRWGYIDRGGREVIETKYLEAGDFHTGLAPVNLDSARLGYKGIIIDTQGEQVTEHRFYSSWEVVDGIISVGAAKRGKEEEYEVVWGYWKPKTDDFITGMDFNFAMPFSGGYGVAKQGDKWGLIDTAGYIRTYFKYDTATSFCNNRSMVVWDSTCGMLWLVGDTIYFEDIIGWSERDTMDTMNPREAK